MSPASRSRGLNEQGACEHPGLVLRGAIAELAADHAAQTRLAERASETAVTEEYRAMFTRWRQVLSRLGAATWEIQLAGETPVACFPGPQPTAALRLHAVYGVPFIPRGVLVALTLAPGMDSPGAGQPPELGAGIWDKLTLLDALYVPGSAPEDRPLTPAGSNGGGDVADVPHPTDSNTSLGDLVQTESLRLVAATGCYLVAVEGPEEAVRLARRDLASALRVAWHAEDPEVGEDTRQNDRGEVPAVGSEVMEEEPSAEVASTEDEAASEGAVSAGPRDWGLRQVILVPQDGSLRADGPGGEKGVAGRAEAQAFLAGLSSEIRDRFRGRKRRAILWVTVEPRGNIWRITGLEERGPEEGDSSG